MFYEIIDDHISAKVSERYPEKHLIDLTEITRVEEIEHRKLSDYNRVEYWLFSIYTKHDKDSWNMTYLTERDCKAALESLKDAIRQNIGIYEPLSKAEYNKQIEELFSIVNNKIDEEPTQTDPYTVPEVRF